MKTIGEIAKEFRELKGWNTTKMAKEVGTSRQSIENLEAVGGRTPRYVKDLARVIGITVDDLLKGSASNAPGASAASVGIRINTTSPIEEIEATVESLSKFLERLTPAERATALGKIGKMEDAYDSASLKKTIVDALRPQTVGEAAAAFTQQGKKAA